jgi:hypothetical protein
LGKKRGDTVKNQPIMLRAAQESSQKPIYARIKGEPARYFMLFRRYCEMGRKRSLQALWDEEREAQPGPETHSSENQQIDTSVRSVSGVSVSGAWKRAASQWQWKERAEAWDIDQRQAKEQSLQKYLDHDAEFLTRAQRLSTLDIAVGSLHKWIFNEQLMEQDPKYFQWAIKQIQSLLRDIRREMAYIEK